MMATISVIVSTFGEAKWMSIAQRALNSAFAQSEPAHEVLYNHCDNLRAARNDGAGQAAGDWLCFVDADDELDVDFIAAMSAHIDTLDVSRETWDYLIRPATRGVYPDGREDSAAVVLTERSLINQNFMVIATVMPRSLFLAVGGFHDWPIYEDWDLWLRCVEAGAKYSACPEAIYRIHVNPDSRNQQDRKVQIQNFTAIRNQYKRSRVFR